jgi:predicted ribosome quality control (RQC) complex YloA/Tae2 family protein
MHGSSLCRRANGLKSPILPALPSLSASLPLSPRQHHEARKKQLGKRDKTLAANEAALRAAEKKAAAQLATLRAGGGTATVVRKPAWYERFNWFISSENFLVISGRDAQQNELIVKRYFR